MIGIIDYGMGNLRSVERAFAEEGFATFRIRVPEDFHQARRLVLPGVGTFGQAMRNLESQNLVDALRDQVFVERKPLLGLCLGLQLVFETGEEFGHYRGLALIPGHVRRFPIHLQVPHIGWNKVRQVVPDPIFDGLTDGAYFYFLHSYIAHPERPECVIGETEHDLPFPSVVRSGNVIAAQFHPEKSQRAGLRFIRNFALQDHPVLS